MLSQTNAVAAIAGVSSDFGLYASVYGFRGVTQPVGSTAGGMRNFGGKIGYYDDLKQFDAANTRVNISLAYMSNIWETDFFSPPSAPAWKWFGVANGAGDWYKRNHPCNNKGQVESVGAISLHGDLAYKSFSMSANYVSAIADMISDSLMVTNQSTGVTGTTNYISSGNNRSRLWAADVGADYSFKTWKRNSSLGAEVQWTGNGSWVGDNGAGRTDWLRIMPRWRLLAEYKINLFKNTDLSLVATHGKSYDFTTTNTGGGLPARGLSDPEDNTNKTVSTGLARLNIQF